ncbi:MULTISPECIES: hypothetical protein [unclassified Isoptericola]|uniref:hypothetical protein n=1 Tax=unclassified Isoptericola TaxID=2623355 RepID=UPI00365C9C75
MPPAAGQLCSVRRPSARCGTAGRCGWRSRTSWAALRDAEIGADAATVRVRLPAMAARHEPERVLAVVRRHLGW